FYLQGKFSPWAPPMTTVFCGGTHEVRSELNDYEFLTKLAWRDHSASFLQVLNVLANPHDDMTKRSTGQYKTSFSWACELSSSGMINFLEALWTNREILRVLN